MLAILWPVFGPERHQQAGVGIAEAKRIVRGLNTQGLETDTGEVQLDKRKNNSIQVESSSGCGVFVLEDSQDLNLMLALFEAEAGLETTPEVP